MDEGTLTQSRWQELVDGMTQADNSRETVVAHCRTHQLIARKPLTSDPVCSTLNHNRTSPESRNLPHELLK